ncbi:MAG: septum formation initiator family protein [Desulfobacterales bacterium]|nr:septum formation initiator family protein [Desulfobacterales bacterium]
MNTKHSILMALSILLIFSMVLLVIFGRKGLADLKLLHRERASLVEKNMAVSRKNLALYREMDRMNNDLKYIEDIARRELGMIGKEEYIIKLAK